MPVKKAVLPAAGLGTRFLPATKAAPKEMLPIVDKPLIQYATEEGKRCGIKDYVVITGKNKRSIEDHFDVALELEECLREKHRESLLEEINALSELRFAFVRQGKALGLGHAISCAESCIGYDPFAVILSDDLLDESENLLEEMINIYEDTNAPVVALQEVDPDDVSRYGVIKGEEIEKGFFRVQGLVEKPSKEDAPSSLAVIGRYVLTPNVFSVLRKIPRGRGGEYQLTDALNEMASNEPLYGYLYHGKRYDAGDKLGFIKATIDFAVRRKEFTQEIKEHINALAQEFDLDTVK